VLQHSPSNDVPTLGHSRHSDAATDLLSIRWRTQTGASIEKQSLANIGYNALALSSNEKNT